MTDENQVPNEEEQTGDAAGQPEAQPAEAAAQAVPVLDAREVEEGKAFAILSYVLSLICIPFFIVPLVMRNNEFSLYHAKQNLMLWLFGVAGSVVSGILTMVCIGVILWIAVMVAWIVFAVMGIVTANKGEMNPLPLIGKWGDEWFKGIKKA